MSGIEKAVDLSRLLDDDRFQNAFCGGCACRPKLYFEECPAGFDPESRKCLRYWAFKSIKESLQAAEDEIISEMRTAGCIA